MNFKLVALVATCVVQVLASKRHEASKWYPCPHFSNTVGLDPELATLEVECGKFSAPLCYSDVCTAPESVNQSIEVFVKRFPAFHPETAINIWVVEYSALLLFSKRNGSANIYMMHARGSGKSTTLICGVTTTNSYSDLSMDPAQAESCAINLESKYGDLVAFSPTSAAHDLFYLISKLSNGAHTFVYGTNYEALIVERLMHLAPPEVIGYVLDSSMSTTGIYNYYTEFDLNNDEVATTFMERCDHDRVCSSHFKKPDTLTDALQDIMSGLDNQVDSACFEIMNTMNVTNEKWPASHRLRKLLSALLVIPTSYTTIPQFVYRLKRCQSHDADVLKTFINNIINSRIDTSISSENSDMLQPHPVLGIVGETNTFASGIEKALYGLCRGLGHTHQRSFVLCYVKRTIEGVRQVRFWQASVLVLSSKMDIFTPYKYTKRIFESLTGKRKELITFEIGSGATLHSTPYQLRVPSMETCGLSIIDSYLQSDGDLAGLG
ncbi:uncharacterized protein PHALS_07370 [Plasmopara halstedii]|uniref:Uncharacterized protein n=1 Tax=Plasmopara halstedii TaxID=4781 RepID=A0A0P1B4D2_PLAHL|nr:uncharacterized protein PHALS_07370 [Plasmopara halstedii]CEG49615.1 hypothetical protein PHALS_07370 [Plasmopara halstedii]|eukprot:XP_024585984.1 hypothetical protein PHALS_07370 [Plasmopara halstedii]